MRRALLTLLIIASGTLKVQLANADLNRRSASDEGYQVMVIPKEMNAVQKELNKEYEVLIPKNVDQGDNTGSVAAKVGDQVVQNWLSSDAGSGVSQSVKTVENSMKAEAVVGSADPAAGTQHRFGFNVQAIQASTELKYSGWWEAVLKYSARDRATIFEVKEKVFSNKDLFLNHTANSDEGKSSLGVRWNW